MISEQSSVIATKAKRFYESELREPLEKEHQGKYACIEPISGRYFLGDTFDEAVNAAIDALPERLTYTLRIGHDSALHIGVLTP